MCSNGTFSFVVFLAFQNGTRCSASPSVLEELCVVESGPLASHFFSAVCYGPLRATVVLLLAHVAL